MLLLKYPDKYLKKRIQNLTPANNLDDTDNESEDIIPPKKARSWSQNSRNFSNSKPKVQNFFCISVKDPSEIPNFSLTGLDSSLTNNPLLLKKNNKNHSENV
ncbi:hypothetical protein BpHYR1_017900 [Brachionus plicatilis]|uniref:Uncharacterized protein n=1 Tax=Brachionus plicatilis TaxID=10195 RepID=A0A3M7SX42_BRAPC|nr:hypothetical protein BpHYR1_017900 [Brachionus plicatilis]